MTTAANRNTDGSRKPLARMGAEKLRPRTVKMTDSMYQRFTDAALAEGEQNITGYIRACALIGLDYRERDRLIRTHSGRTGNPGIGGGSTRGMTAG